MSIYRAAMRRFIVRRLRQIPGIKVEEVIKASFRDYRADRFLRDLQANRNLEDCIDVDDFPMLLVRNWREVFADYFRHERDIQNSMWIIKSARDKEVAHPPSSDIGQEEARVYLFHIEDVLRLINEADAADQVSNLKSGLPDPNLDRLAKEVAQLAVQFSSISGEKERLDSEMDMLSGEYSEFREQVGRDIQSIKESLTDLVQVQQNLTEELSELKHLPTVSTLVEALAEQIEALQDQSLVAEIEEESKDFDDDLLDDLDYDFEEDLEDDPDDGIQYVISERHYVRRPPGLFSGARYFCLESTCRFYDGTPRGWFHEYKAINHQMETGHEFGEV